MENVLLFVWVLFLLLLWVFFFSRLVRYFGRKTFLIKVEAQRKWNEGANMISFIDIKNSYILCTLNFWPVFVNKCVHLCHCCHLVFASKSPANNSFIVQLNYEGVQPLNVTIWVLLYAFAFATHTHKFMHSPKFHIIIIYSIYPSIPIYII